MATPAELLIAYRTALRAHEAAESAMRASSDALRDAGQELAAALIPTNAKAGERIGIYVGNDLVVLQAVGPGSGVIERLQAGVRPAARPDARQA